MTRKNRGKAGKPAENSTNTASNNVAEPSTEPKETKEVVKNENDVKKVENDPKKEEKISTTPKEASKPNSEAKPVVNDVKKVENNVKKEEKLKKETNNVIQGASKGSQQEKKQNEKKEKPVKEKQKNEPKKKDKKEQKQDNNNVEGSVQGLQPEKGILKVRFVPGTTSDNTSESPPPMRRYPYILSHETNVHPLFARMKARTDFDTLYGIESVILEFLNNLALFINEYNGTSKKPYKEELFLAIQPQLSYLTENGLRHFPLALGNVIRQFKRFLQQISGEESAAQVRQQCKEWLDDFYRANYVQATQAIVEFTIEKIYGLAATNIVTFGWSPVIERVLLNLSERTPEQWEIGVLDSEPSGRALQLAKSLALRGVQTTYGQLSSVGDITRHAHIILLGGSVVLSNGHVLAPRGAGLLALAARARNIPVLVSVKSYQFVDKVRTLHKHTAVVLDTEPLELIQADLITALVTEIRILPPTSAPAVLKAKQLVSI